MCWSATASVAMVALGTMATTVTALRGEPKPIWIALGYFTVMEALQAAGYAVVDDCGSPGNRAITMLSYLHIAFQPLVINGFAMAIAPTEVSARTRHRVYAVAAVCSALILMRLAPFGWAGRCLPGESMCGDLWCTISGEWHIGWLVPLNGLYNPLGEVLGMGVQFPDYFLAVFLLPLLYGAWRFVLLNLLAGPVLAHALTDNPHEVPAIWCLFSISILLIGLSPFIRYRVMGAHLPAPA